MFRSLTRQLAPWAALEPSLAGCRSLLPITSNQWLGPANAHQQDARMSTDAFKVSAGRGCGRSAWGGGRRPCPQAFTVQALSSNCTIPPATSIIYNDTHLSCRSTSTMRGLARCNSSGSQKKRCWQRRSAALRSRHCSLWEATTHVKAGTSEPQHDCTQQ